MHHLAALYTVELIDNQTPAGIGRFEEQDSLGMEWADLAALSPDSASPLVVLAVKWLSGMELAPKAEYYEQWEIKEINQSSDF